MHPVATSNFLAARASTTGEAAPPDLPGSPAIAAVLISISIVVLAATLLILHRLWRSHSRRRTKASLDEFDMVDANQTRPSMRTTATPDNVERRKFSVIDVSPEAALRLGLVRHSTTPFLSTTSVSSNPTLMQIDVSSNSHPPISHHRTITMDSLAPSIASNLEKPLPRRPSQAGSSYPLRAQQSVEPGNFPHDGSSPARSSLSHSRSGSEVSLFGFIQNRASSIRAENDGQVVAGDKLHHNDQISAIHKHNTDFTDLLIHSGQDARLTLPPPWFERVASTSRAHQPTIDTSRIPHHHLDITIPEPLQTTRRYSYHPLCRTHSTATTVMTLPPPPYTPLDTNFEVPPLPQMARLHPSQYLILATNSPPHGPTLGHPPTQPIPAFTPCTSDSKATLRSQCNQQRSNDHGTVMLTRPRSNSLPIQNASLPPGPISARRQSRVGTLRPLHINTGAGMTGRAWLPSTIDEIVSTTPSRGTFMIDE